MYLVLSVKAVDKGTILFIRNLINKIEASKSWTPTPPTNPRMTLLSHANFGSW
jgi:hypothetical protein